MVNVGKYTKIVPFFVDLGIVFMDPWLPIPSDEAYSLPSKEGWKRRNNGLEPPKIELFGSS